ncbi:hypothetical protein HF086_005238 [Spodoptera exigua]|uniref:Uncharacterized protein n=1 Tax=Spodoptera exigua TaxID=7107 RepID=A0A922SSP7_SPOEX|nr:hypothetical protein HF086_005238 [Spodoptera exigua]
MALLYIAIALAIQGSFAFDNVTESLEYVNSCEVVNTTMEVENEVIAEPPPKEQKEWIDFFLLPDTHLHPTSSVAMMTQAINSEKSVEEQLDEIKEIAQKITLAIQSEMANLLSYALNSIEKTEMNLEKTTVGKNDQLKLPWPAHN